MAHGDSFMTSGRALVNASKAARDNTKEMKTENPPRNPHIYKGLGFRA